MLSRNPIKLKIDIASDRSENVIRVVIYVLRQSNEMGSRRGRCMEGREHLFRQ